MYRIDYRRDAQKALVKMPPKLRTRIRDAIDALAEDPFNAQQVKPLSGEAGAYRLRVGDWRVVYTIDEGAVIITVVRIKPRGDAYK